VASCLPQNVIVEHSPARVVWGAVTVLDAELSCIRQLLTLSGDWKYFINLVGKDFPLKTNLELVRILKAFRGANNIEALDFS
jgi:Core-2/I-Branching enzyme